MNLVHFTLQPRAPVVTPFRGDTLLGHMLWQYAFKHGSEAMDDAFFARLAEMPPALSDLFPAGRLPIPKLPLRAEGDNRKAIKNVRYLPVQEINRLQEKLTSVELLSALKDAKDNKPEQNVVEVAELHATIDRLTGTTPSEGGGLYARPVQHFGVIEKDGRSGATTLKPTVLHGYMAPGVFGDEAKELLVKVGEYGYGADSSTGLGVFCVNFDDEELHVPKVSNSWMALSRHLPDPRVRATDGYYGVETHYGRLGGSFANNGNPFKKPILLCSTGSLWRGTSSGVCGAMLDRVANRTENIRHLGFTIPLHFNLIEEK